MKTKAKKFKEIETQDKVQLVAKWLDEKQGNDVAAIDVQGICPIAESVMVVGAKGVRHAQALADFVLEQLSKENIEYLGLEGYKSGDWILFDLNDIILHIFQEENRGFYNVEGLWSEGKKIELNLN
ncbi:ribosome silencing factor [Maridesulfovibrio hydrothermalis]|uniref:Ribosomal silencing factor RsfS n=1 Tax=Maridesulfovibrio hydrothermalis AM13 = DSM 14728 TaxID=1121451 RepID=L0REI1_9BACT|nr:ribosome silencing factor [Maridesulfovibrio hydrothermalis]CCO24600.1 Iojap-like protein [Maridesulfovibrio hydrothermalis AM13 = DSM 14728]